MVNAHHDITTQSIIVSRLHDALTLGSGSVAAFTRTFKSEPLNWIPVGAIFKGVRSLYTGPVIDNTSFVGTKLIGASPPFTLKMETDLVSETFYVLNSRRCTRNNKMSIIAIANLFACTYML